MAKKQKRKQFVLYSYTSDFGNAMYNITREDIMPFRPVQVLMTGTYSACVSKLTEGWTKQEKAGIDTLPTMYKRKG
jgi:hypothetical protein